METNRKLTEASQYSALTLAYLGDAVFELYIRNHLLKNGNCPSHKLHQISKGYVSASAQSKSVDVILEFLNKDEEAVYKRGRNAKAYTSPKNASVVDYRRATGMEALIGYLYLTGNNDRIDFLMKKILQKA